MAITLNGTVRLAGFILAVVLIIAGIAASWGEHRARDDQQEDDTTALKADGCSVANTNVTSIAVIENDLEHIKKAQVDNTAAIIKAIKER